MLRSKGEHVLLSLYQQDILFNEDYLRLDMSKNILIKKAFVST